MKLFLTSKRAAVFGISTLLLLGTGCHAKCPFLRQQEAARKQDQQQQRPLPSTSTRRALNERSGDGGIPDGGFAAVREDIVAMLTNSQDFWPADFGHYGGLLIRLAWHCAGSFRETDGRGGCDGGRIRFDPELTWMDNGNLDKALKLLEPIKEKYGSKLSWGDLVILAGTTAMEDMGLPATGFCGGRIDDPDGSNSLILGPSEEQEAIAQCLSLEPSQQGMCNLVEGSAIGPTTIGLIYVDPSGPINDPDNPEAAGPDVRRTFGRMGFNDTETVALVGGGHAFGKCHGACMNPPCGEGELQGKGNNTYTAGYEGKWSTTPTKWSNEYFNNLFDYEWILVDGPGGFTQWAPNTTDGSTPPNTIMLTADLALMADEIYKPISQAYAADLSLLEKDFTAAWYRLTSADMGPATRCIGEYVRPPQHWQHTLPEFTGELPDFTSVRTKIQELLDADDANYEAFVNLAYQCASTFRETDYRGGCNGARIRFSPESEWDVNVGTADALATLEAVKTAYPSASYADIIVLAGQTAIESAGGMAQPFCGGRVDAEDGLGSEGLAPRVYDPPVVSIRDDMQVKGLSAREGVALAGRFFGASFSNQFYKDLLGGSGNFTADELALLEDEFKPIVEEYANDKEAFQKEFANAWNKMMTADRYDGPFENACRAASPAPTPTASPPGSCVNVMIDFSKDADDVALLGGAYVDDEWEKFGLVLSSSGGLGEAPRLFDTANPGSVDAGDPDLGSPHKLCNPPGPGVGAGGRPGTKGENCSPLGNVLIIQEDNGDASMVPDDNHSGGTITFSFVKQAALVYEVGFLDLPVKATLTIDHVNDLGMEETVIDLPSYGSNAVQKVSVNKANVEQMTLRLPTSGAVTFLSFCYDP